MLEYTHTKWWILGKPLETMKVLLKWYNKMIGWYWGYCLPFPIVWMRGKTLQEWRGFIFVSLYKTSLKVICYNYCRISLLSDVGKIFAKLLLTWLLDHVALNILPELQCGFWPNRGTTDMIFWLHKFKRSAAWSPQIFICQHICWTIRIHWSFDTYSYLQSPLPL